MMACSFQNYNQLHFSKTILSRFLKLSIPNFKKINIKINIIDIDSQKYHFSQYRS